MTLQTEGDYYSRREQAERAASRTACSPEARQAHAKLAELYAEMRRRDAGDLVSPDSTISQLPRVVIL